MYPAPALDPKRINIGLQSSAVEEVGSLLLLPGLERYDDALQDMDSDICASETLHLCAGEVGLLRNEVCQAKYDSANTKRKLWRPQSRQSPCFGKDARGFTSNFSAEENWSTSSLAGPSPVGLHAFRRTRLVSGQNPNFCGPTNGHKASKSYNDKRTKITGASSVTAR